jgi:hypothetical protein
MKLPGFTADSSLGASHERYRTNIPERAPVGAIPQSGTEPCYDWRCVIDCQAKYPEDPAACIYSCQVPCPYGPDYIPAPG